MLKSTINQNIIPKRKPTLNNTLYNPPPHYSITPGQVLHFRSGKVEINKTIRNIVYIPNSLCVIGHYQQKYFLKIGDISWTEIVNPKSLVFACPPHGIPERLVIKVIQNFCQSL